MTTDNTQQLMQIIIKSGNARKSILEANQYSRHGNFIKAKESLDAGEKSIIEVHQIHTQLLGEDVYNQDLNILSVHAEDHMMTTMLLLDMAKEFKEVYQLIHDK